MTRLVFITQQIDPGHPALAATLPKIAALAERVDEVLVLAGGAVPGTLPDNCRVRVFRAGTKAGRGRRFLAALAPELASRRGRPDAILAHMCPIYAVLSAPLARPLGVPVLLWFTQWRATGTLRLAERLSSAVVTVDRRSFPFSTEKAVAIGHGIDVDEFACLERNGAPPAPLRVLALGRYASVKGYEAVLRAIRMVADAGVGVSLRICGPTLTPSERAHRSELERLVAELDLGDVAALTDAVPRSEVPALLAGADVLVNNTRAGAADKVVYEAAAACVPAIASPPVFDQLLPTSLRFAPDDAAGLADRLVAFARLDGRARAELGRSLREHVASHHSVASWADGVLGAAGLR